MTKYSKKFEYIINCISRAGFDPAGQICSYLQTQDNKCITSNGNACDLIRYVDLTELERFAAQVALQENQDA